jgi:hypothetical protein
MLESCTSEVVRVTRGAYVVAGYSISGPYTRQPLKLLFLLAHEQPYTLKIRKYSILMLVLIKCSVGIATGYGLDGPGIESLWG